MNALRTARAFRASYYRFVHTSGSHENSPEMLGTARSESEGFSAQLTYGSSGMLHRLSRTAPMCEDPARILAMVLVDNT